MDRATLERHQVWLYLIAIAAGLAGGARWPSMAPVMEALLWPTLALLLFATFVQVPLWHLREAFADRRFMVATLAGNFVLLPLLVWALMPTLPDDPALVLGVLLVLLVPCTDWFITFAQLGRGHVPRAIAVTPLNLLLQLVMLPAWLWVMTPMERLPRLGVTELAPALLLVLVPLALAALAERWIEARTVRDIWRQRLAWWPVPLLSVVVFEIAAAQVGAVMDARALLGAVLLAFVLFLLGAAVLAVLISRVLRLPFDQGRTLAFGFGTRNSFVVLPFALSLPPGWELAAVVIVIQSLVELLGMVAFLWWVPRRLFPDPT